MFFFNISNFVLIDILFHFEFSKKKKSYDEQKNLANQRKIILSNLFSFRNGEKENNFLLIFPTIWFFSDFINICVWFRWLLIVKCRSVDGAVFR